MAGAGVVTVAFRVRGRPSTSEGVSMNATWSYEQGRIWATCGGRRLPTWTADPAHAGLVDLLNANPTLSALLLAPWLVW